MTEELIAPLFTNDEPGPKFTIAEVATRLAEPGVTADYIAGQARRWAKDGIVQTRGQKGSGPTAHNLFALSDTAVIKILSVLNETAAMKSEVILRAVALDLYSWRTPEVPEGPHAPAPIWEALAGVDRGEHWMFRLTILQNDQTGDRQYRAHVFRMPPEGAVPPATVWLTRPAEGGGTEHVPMEEYLPRLTITIPLLLPFTRLLVQPSPFYARNTVN